MNNLKDDDRLGQLEQLDRLNRLSTPDIKSYIKMTEPDDKFPTLSRRDGSNLVSFMTTWTHLISNLGLNQTDHVVAALGQS
jgi:hypothetical protein